MIRIPIIIERQNPAYRSTFLIKNLGATHEI